MTLDTHLGRSADGTKNAVYVTPREIDPSLLVAVPREDNRLLYNIHEESLPFVGTDVWHCYEFCYLDLMGFPQPKILKISYPADSKYIVESKSLKLYLNSWNFVIPANILPPLTVRSKIADDLSSLLKTEVSVDFNDSGQHPERDKIMNFSMARPAYYTEKIFHSENEDPSLLKSWAAWPREWACSTNILRSNCKITNQPDWGSVYVYLNGRNAPESDESFLKYIYSFRNENHFHEECGEMIYKRFWDTYKPDELLVACLYTRRGGIDINPVRASNPTLLRMYCPALIDVSRASVREFRQ